MEFLQNTLILATLVAVGLYYLFARQSQLQPTSHKKQLDVDDRKKRREHLAKTAEARVATLQGDDCTKTREMQSRLQSRDNEQKVTKDTSISNAVATTEGVEKQPTARMSGKIKSELEKSVSEPDVYLQKSDDTDNNRATDVSRSAAAATNQVSVEKSAKESNNGSSMNAPIESIAEATVEEFKPEKVCDHAMQPQDKVANTVNDPANGSSEKYDNAIVIDRDIQKVAPDDKSNIPSGSIQTCKTEQSFQDQRESNINHTPNATSKNETQPPPTQSITIHLILTSSPTKPNIPLQISQSCTVSQLRQSASEASSVPLDDMRVIYRGKVLSDDRSVAKHGLEDGSVLHLVGKPIVVDDNNESDALNTEFGGVSRQPIVDNEVDEPDDIDEHSNEDESLDLSIVSDIRPPIHAAAATGDMFTLRHAALHDLTALYEQDINGWTPLHEATRSGLAHVIKFLVLEAEKNGIPPVTVVNIVSNFGNGWSPLAIAILNHGEWHAVTVLLRQFGGEVVYPSS
jgi:hypothetical protein